MNDTTYYTRRVEGIIRAAGLNWIHVRSRTIPWNAARYSYQRCTTIIPMSFGDYDAVTKAVFPLESDADVEKVIYIDGQQGQRDRGGALRPQVRVIWR